MCSVALGAGMAHQMTFAYFSGGFETGNNSAIQIAGNGNYGAQLFVTSGNVAEFQFDNGSSAFSNAFTIPVGTASPTLTFSVPISLSNKQGSDSNFLTAGTVSGRRPPREW